MKNHLHFMNNEAGFVLPYVLFIATIIFIILSANITIYQHEQAMTEHHLEQLKIETIVQIGREMVTSELINNDELTTVHYALPDGSIKIIIVQLSESEYHLHMTIATEKVSAYTIRNRLFLHDDES